jgi:(N-acetylneuraminyl)-galactosylglucosylceramide N-acetylgalactosaminyltransferase
LIDSILALYPGVTIIMTDDNPDEYFQTVDAVKYPTVKHYKMPLEEGFFAGRALAVSQVKTGKEASQF